MRIKISNNTRNYVWCKIIQNNSPLAVEIRRISTRKVFRVILRLKYCFVLVIVSFFLRMTHQLVLKFLKSSKTSTPKMRVDRIKWRYLTQADIYLLFVTWHFSFTPTHLCRGCFSPGGCILKLISIKRVLNLLLVLRQFLVGFLTGKHFN